MDTMCIDLNAGAIHKSSESSRSIVRIFLTMIALILLSFFASFPAQAAPPPNDNFIAAELISGSSGNAFTLNSSASAELGEPAHINPAANSVWFKWLAPNSDPIDFDTQSSNFDTVLAVYSGTALNNLVLIASNDNDPLLGCCNSRVSFTPTAGQTYYIAVDGLQPADVGRVYLQWGLAPKSIRGTLSLPNGELAPAGGLTIGMRFIDQNSFRDPTVTVTIPEAMNSADYVVTVPDDANADWLVSYECNSIAMGCGGSYYTSGYYGISGTQWNSAFADVLAGGQHYNNINLSVLTGKLVSGSLSLPNAELAPVSLSIDVFATNVNGPEQYSDRFSLPANMHATSYELILPDIAGAESASI